jgi:hypothetical protein
MNREERSVGYGTTGHVFLFTAATRVSASHVKAFLMAAACQSGCHLRVADVRSIARRDTSASRVQLA